MTDNKPKLLEFPKMANNLTWGAAMKGFIDASDPKALEIPVRNMIIITDSPTQYHFGILNQTEIRSLMGSMTCVMTYLTDSLTCEVEEYDEDD